MTNAWGIGYSANHKLLKVLFSVEVDLDSPTTHDGETPWIR